MENNKEKLIKYHEQLLKDIYKVWLNKELLKLFKDISHVMCLYKNMDSFLLTLISTDSSSYDCLMAPFEDMPLFINDNEGMTKYIAKKRLLYGK